MNAVKAETQKPVAEKATKKGVLDAFQLFYESIPSEEEMKVSRSSRIKRASK